MTRRATWRTSLVLALLALSASPVLPSASVSAPVAPLWRAASIASGWQHSCALTTTGAALCWGDNLYGQLGDGTTTGSSVPVVVRGLASGVKAVSAGYSHSCAVTVKGAVKCWGSNAFGQLGDNSTDSSSRPVTAYGLTKGIKTVSAGGVDTCALTTAGTVSCWGLNDDGQLGNGTTTDSHRPVRVHGLGNGVRAISVGLYFACAITKSGAAKCWGSNFYGQLGNGSTTSSSTPVDVIGLGTDVQAIKAGYESACAVTRKGAARCWGANGNGQLGDRSTTDSHRPVTVYHLDARVATIRIQDAHACAVTTAGVARCWGLNDRGQLGDNNTTSSLRPIAVYNLTNATAISTGYQHTCVTTASHQVRCWGRNDKGQLGNGTTVDSHKPVRVHGF